MGIFELLCFGAESCAEGSVEVYMGEVCFWVYNVCNRIKSD